MKSYIADLVAYSRQEKRVYAAYTVLALCRFGRWLTWALCPWLRFFPSLTDSVDGSMSWEMKARLTLRPDPLLPIAVGAIGILPLALNRYVIRKGA